MKIFGIGLFCFCLSFSLLAAEKPSIKPTLKPEATVRACYNYLIKNRVSGAPTEPQMAALKQWLSPKLWAQLQKAGKVRDDFIKKHGNEEKPPFVEGDLFSSTFEGAKAFEITGSVSDERAALCQIIFTYSEAGSQPFRWSDRVKLTRIDGRWLIDDVIYDLPVQFGNSGTLRSSLP